MSKDPENHHDEEMLAEYDFQGGVRGKHFRHGRIHKTDGTTETCCFTIDEGAVLLDPEVQKYFPDSESVNNAAIVLPGKEPLSPLNSATTHRKGENHGFDRERLEAPAL